MESGADEIIEKIAKRRLFLDTLETRGNDRLDFSEQSVWDIRQALLEAFAAGLSCNFRD
jgi:hypothetical protein